MRELSAAQLPSVCLLCVIAETAEELPLFLSLRSQCEHWLRNLSPTAEQQISSTGRVAAALIEVSQFPASTNFRWQLLSATKEVLKPKVSSGVLWETAEAPPVAEAARRFRGSVPVSMPQRGWKLADTTVNLSAAIGRKSPAGGKKEAVGKKYAVGDKRGKNCRRVGCRQHTIDEQGQVRLPPMVTKGEENGAGILLPLIYESVISSSAHHRGCP